MTGYVYQHMTLTDRAIRCDRCEDVRPLGEIPIIQQTVVRNFVRDHADCAPLDAA